MVTSAMSVVIHRHHLHFNVISEVPVRHLDRLLRHESIPRILMPTLVTEIQSQNSLLISVDRRSSIRRVKIWSAARNEKESLAIYCWVPRLGNSVRSGRGREMGAYLLACHWWLDMMVTASVIVTVDPIISTTVRLYTSEETEGLRINRRRRLWGKRRGSQFWIIGLTVKESGAWRPLTGKWSQSLRAKWKCQVYT